MKEPTPYDSFGLNKDVNEIIGGKIKKLRKMRGWTQTELGAKLDCASSGQISLYETGERGINVEMLNKIAQVFGVELGILANGIDYDEDALRVYQKIKRSIDKHLKGKPNKLKEVEAILDLDE